MGAHSVNGWFKYRSRQVGFSLVELLVAVVIGMIGAAVMMQVFAISEDNRRAANSGSDANIEGLSSFYTLQKDIRMAGYGFSDPKSLGCDVVLRTGVTVSGGLSPVVINHANITGQDANTDTVMVMYGNSNMASSGENIITAANGVQNTNMFAANDNVFQVPAARGTTTCSVTLEKITSVTGSATLVLSSGNLLSQGSMLMNLGQTVTAVVYAVRSGNLTRCDYMVNNCGSAANNSSTSVWVPVGGNVVSLRAQYGRDTTSPNFDHTVDMYDQTTPTGNGFAAMCLWARIPGVRIALVARNAQFDKTAVTTAAPAWAGSVAGAPTGSASAAIDLSGNAEWQNYRYKLFQAVVPIRNVSWIGAITGC